MDIDLSALDQVMAAAGQGALADNTGAPLTLDIELIDEDPHQPRSEFDEAALHELATTIAERGVRQPISVRRHPEQAGRWLLNFGASRLRASRLAGKTTIPAFIDDTADTYDQVIENEQRQGLQHLELALFIQRRLAAGDTQADIARHLGKSRMYVTYLCTLIDAPDWLMNAYRQRTCRGITELHELARLHAEMGDEVAAWTGQQASISRADIKALRQALATRQLPAQPMNVPSRAGVSPVIVGPPSVASPPAVATTTAPPVAPPKVAPTTDVASSPPSRRPKRPRLVVQHANQILELLADVVPQQDGMFCVRVSGTHERHLISGVDLQLLRVELAD